MGMEEKLWRISEPRWGSSIGQHGRWRLALGRGVQAVACVTLVLQCAIGGFLIWVVQWIGGCEGACT